MRVWLTGLICALAFTTGAARAAPADSSATAGKAPKAAYLSLIIDDLGQNPERDSRALALPGPVTLAIMPDTPHATDFARQAHKAGKTVMLHMPMDPATGPYAWHPELPLPELESRLNAALLKVPYAAGINNHMGSRMTAAEAQKIGLASVSRDVFLDDERTAEAISGQLQTAIKLAHKQGSAVMIGHPYPVTLDVLERELPKLKSQGIELIEIRHMVTERGNEAMAGHGKNGRYR
jgi:polysaccharide deacetylase 2 family uncharacterized protein YibQ